MYNLKNNIDSRFENFFNIAIDLLCIADSDGIFIKLNREWEKTLGYPVEFLEGKKLTGFVHPDDIPSTEAVLEDMADGKSISNFENRIQCKDGLYKWLEWRTQPIEGLIYAAARDITERKNFEKEIAETLRFNSKIFYASPIGIATYNADGVCKSCNNAYAQIFETSVENMLSISMHDFYAYKKNEFYDLSLKTLSSGVESRKEIQIYTTGSQKEWLDCSITPFTSNSEQHILVQLQDITQKKKSEHLLAQSERRFRVMLSNIQLISIILDMKGKIQFMNDYTLKLTGYSREEAINQDAAELLLPDIHLVDKIREYILDNSLPDHIETILHKKNHEKLIVKWTATILYDENNNFAGVACIGEDVTDFKFYEKILNFRYELAEMEYKNELTTLIQYTLDTAEELTSSKIGFFHFYTEEEKSYILQTASTGTFSQAEMKQFSGELHGIESAGVWSDCVHKREPVIHNDYENLPNKKGLPDGHVPVKRELVFPIIKDEKIVAILGVGNKEQDYSQKDVEIISLLCDALWNVLYKKKTNEALKKSEEQLRALNMTKNRFFSIIAHDLKSPFQGMLGSLQILSSEFDYLTDEEKKGFITSIEKLSQYTYKLLDNLLQWSRIQTERLEYNIQILNVRNAFNDTIELLTHIANSKNIKIIYEIPQEYFVKTDLNIALTVFRNLLSNAIKYTNKGGEVRIYAEERDNLNEIFIEDNGTGMETGEVENLFKIEKQVSRHGTSGETGTGLGLILCKEMIEKIGGSINVKSTFLKGSTFSFTLPKV